MPKKNLKRRKRRKGIKRGKRRKSLVAERVFIYSGPMSKGTAMKGNPCPVLASQVESIDQNWLKCKGNETMTC